MTNVAGVPAFGGGGFAFRQPPDPPEPAVPQIAETALNGTATYTKGNDLPGQNDEQLSYGVSSDAASDAYVQDAYDQTVSDVASQDGFGETLPEDILAGPTPAFQASVLEVELDLRNSIAELAAKRSQETDAASIAPTPTRSAEDMPEMQATDHRNEMTKDQATEELLAQSAAPSEIQDPEAALSGPAAIQRTPFDG